jgi:peptide chain release factor 1
LKTSSASTANWRSGAVFDVSILEIRPGLITFSVAGEKANQVFSNEAGGHRWQRNPPTERNGRVHTSTITVSVLPDCKATDFIVNPDDLEWSTTRGSGPGGQNKNKVETVAVVKHKPTGLTVRSESERSQYRNKQLALQLLTSRLRVADEERKNSQTAAMRKGQVGSGMRGDKRRTIRVQDGTVTDHVTGQKWRYRDYVAGNW